MTCLQENFLQNKENNKGGTSATQEGNTCKHLWWTIYVGGLNVLHLTNSAEIIFVFDNILKMCLLNTVCSLPTPLLPYVLVLRFSILILHCF